MHLLRPIYKFTVHILTSSSGFSLVSLANSLQCIFCSLGYQFTVHILFLRIEFTVHFFLYCRSGVYSETTWQPWLQIQGLQVRHLWHTSGFWPRVRTRLFQLIATPNRALRAPPPIVASLLIIRPPKMNKIYRTCAAHIQVFFLSTGPQRIWNMRSLAPAPPIAASPILSAIFWGQNVPVRPYALTFSIFLFVILFFFFSPF